MRGEKPSLKATCYFLNTKGSKEPTCNAGNLARMWVWFLGQETILEKEMATHSSILAWKIPWTAHGVGKVRHDLVTKQQTRTSKTMLNKSDQSRHLCSIPDLRGNTFSFAHLGIIWPLLCWGKFPLCPLSGEYFFFFIINGVEFVEFLHVWRWSYGFYSSVFQWGVLYWLICRYWRILAFLDKYHLIMVYELFLFIYLFLKFYF